MVELKLAADNVSGNESLRLPRNIEAEAALVGALLIDNRIAEDVQQKLKPEHFHDPLHGRIYELVLKLLDKNMVANAVTLRPMLEHEPGMADQGGAGAYLAQISANSISVIGARDFARQIYDLALLRELIGVGRTLVESALDTSESIDPLGQIEAAEVALYKVSEGEGESGSVKTFVTAATMAVQ
ncbi:MAG TPA: DnaB-like helicase N-terminal domain-containing protein, partial [Sphingobium sp.]